MGRRVVLVVAAALLLFSNVAGAAVIKGTKRSDFLRGGARPDRIDAKAGNDRIRGFGGDDCLNGQGGADRVGGGNGADVLRGSGGRDRLAGGLGKDLVIGGKRRDRIFANDQTADVIRCGKGRECGATAALAHIDDDERECLSCGSVYRLLPGEKALAVKSAPAAVDPLVRRILAAREQAHSAELAKRRTAMRRADQYGASAYLKAVREYEQLKGIVTGLELALSFTKAFGDWPR